MKIHTSYTLAAWPEMERLLETLRISYVDYALAEALLGEMTTDNENVAIFIAYLSLIARQGHLCLKIENDTIQPDPLQVFVQSNFLSDEITEIPFEKEIKDFTEKVISGSRTIPKNLITDVESDSKIVITPICHWKDLYYFQKNWYFESFLLKHFSRLEGQSPKPELSEELISSKIGKLKIGNKLLPDQIQSIKQALKKSISLIYGGPGTGKTYSAACLIQIYLECLEEDVRKNIQIAFAAPTGKAAARLSESLNKVLKENPSLKLPTATTLHSLLSIHPSSNSMAKQLRADLIVVDECSMIDVKMMGHLFSAVKNGARLILLGDGDQLPSVEAGSIFSDLIKFYESKYPGIKLQASLRSKIGPIIKFSEAVYAGNSGNALQLLAEGKQENGLSKIKVDGRAEIIKIIASHYYSFKGDSHETFCALTPLRKGPFGVDELNKLVFEEVTKKSQKNQPLHIPIIITRNDSRYGLYNGDAGVLVKNCPTENDYVTFPSKGPNFKLPAFLLSSYEYAYCVTVYKGQGSEYDHVLLILPEGSEWFGREVLYTAATRAKKLLEVWSTDQVIEGTISRTTSRMSGLARRLM
jgi:exodeoxyribonuclease V alpha subunit